MKKPTVYFITAAPLGVSPSQRFRFEHYLPYLEEKGIRYRVSPYLSMKNRDVLYKSPSVARKTWAVILGYGRRLADLFRVWGYDFIYIHREATPVGPPFFEWVVSRLFRKKVIYDFDDAIWVPTMSEHNRKFRFARSFSKIGKICRWSWLVTVGNRFLADYAGRFSKNVKVIPTVVDTEGVHNRMQEQDTNSPNIGWTGSFTTLPYLNTVIPVLQRLQERFAFTFIVIADRDPQLPLKNYRFIYWNRETETEDLLRFHIGLMPLTDTEISRGKCGFKAIQYMSLGIPPVVSPVGVNTEIVDTDINGFICAEEKEWELALEKLLTDGELRKRLGREARKKIEQSYSVISTKELFLANFLPNQ